MDLLEWRRKHLEDDSSDLLREMVRVFAERRWWPRSTPCAAPPMARSPGTGHQPQRAAPPGFDTRVGTIDLAIAKLRHDSYHPG
jgi:hypothetical protein